MQFLVYRKILLTVSYSGKKGHEYTMEWLFENNRLRRSDSNGGFKVFDWNKWMER